MAQEARMTKLAFWEGAPALIPVLANLVTAEPGSQGWGLSCLLGVCVVVSMLP